MTFGAQNLMVPTVSSARGRSGSSPLKVGPIHRQVVAELSFGFCHCMLARCTPHCYGQAAPGASASRLGRSYLELPVRNMRRRRSRVVHGEPVIAEAIPARCNDILAMTGPSTPYGPGVDIDSRVPLLLI